jgi:hypothetical protein
LPSNTDGVRDPRITRNNTDWYRAAERKRGRPARRRHAGAHRGRPQSGLMEHEATAKFHHAEHGDPRRRTMCVGQLRRMLPGQDRRAVGDRTTSAVGRRPVGRRWSDTRSPTHKLGPVASSLCVRDFVPDRHAKRDPTAQAPWVSVPPRLRGGIYPRSPRASVPWTSSSRATRITSFTDWLRRPPAGGLVEKRLASARDGLTSARRCTRSIARRRERPSDSGPCATLRP